MAVFTLRGQRIRIISARDMSRRERRIHEEARKDSSAIP
ncbi:MAG: BrnT family toxin [Gammaproteobacteria bacterium]|nr:BrnT family toxin [Gammaproteobacteria bacterium]